MRKLNVLLTIILFVLLPLVTIGGCQEQPASTPAPTEALPPTPAPTPTPAPLEPEEEYVPDQIIVKFKAGTPIEEEEQLNQSLGTTVIYTSPSAGFKVLQIPEGKTVAEMVEAYSKQPIVEYAEPNYIERIQPESK